MTSTRKKCAPTSQRGRPVPAKNIAANSAQTQEREKSKSSRRKYGKAAGKTVASAMRRKKHGTLRSGKGGKGGKVTSRKQRFTANQTLSGSLVQLV
jgi:hypothetical protein